MNKTQPTYYRQRFLLAFIRQINSSVTSTDLQKLVFLYSMKENSEFYEFLPYKFGSYSFQLAEDVDILIRDGYLILNENRIKAAGEYKHENLFNIADERGNELIRKAYIAYPYYSINSEMVNRLFHGDEVERFTKEKEKYLLHEQTLFTIGYEGKSIEAFLNILIKNGVNLLCDVRKNPISRKFGFSKSKLEHITSTIGIEYVHIPELGIETNMRNSLTSENDYKVLFENYAKTLPEHTQQLKQIYSLLQSDKRIALMCYEKDAIMCHRHVVRDYITSTYDVRSVDL